MKAPQIAALIELVAKECQLGNMSFDVHTDLNAALWNLAMEHGIREDVHVILQENSEAEMTEAVQSSTS